MMLYGQFVGDWDFDWTGFDAAGNERLTTKGEWLFMWVLEGRAVQDVWICPARDLRGRPGAPKDAEYGTTIRFFDPTLNAWRVMWNGPGGGNVRVFFAYSDGDEIVQVGFTPEGQLLHWIFSDITETSFTWRSQVMTGNSWRLRERMLVRRR